MATVTPIRKEIEQPRGAVSNRTYDVLTVLQNKLEALAAYDKYVADFSGETEGRRLLEQIRSDDERHCQMLRDHIEQLCRQGKFQ